MLSRAQVGIVFTVYLHVGASQEHDLGGLEGKRGGADAQQGIRMGWWGGVEARRGGGTGAGAMW